MQSCNVNIKDDSSGDEASDDNANSVGYEEPLPPLVSSSDDDFDDVDMQDTFNAYITPKWAPFMNGFGYLISARMRP